MSKPKTRDKLLNAGLEEIYKHGFQGVSIDIILKFSNVTKGSMYHHC
ncbi:MAG TPA: TetR/AcrR family transcriptional regulator [Sulfurimonas sp.]|nr:TetR/AcrR family transcriptional regulator [Sulfurimonas sp.]